MKKQPQITNKINSAFISRNLYSYCHVDYHTEYHCKERGCDSICRCGTIEDAKVDEVDIKSILYQISKNCNPFITYCVDRILTINKIYIFECYDVCITGGYYGEEIEKVTLNHQLISRIQKNLDELNAITNDIERIFYVLIQEYGYILESLKNLTKASIQNVKKDLVVYGNKEYIKKIDSKGIYGEYSLPKAVCYKSEDKYRIVDGYHRMAENTKPTVDIIVLE